MREGVEPQDEGAEERGGFDSVRDTFLRSSLAGRRVLSMIGNVEQVIRFGSFGSR